VVIAVAVTSGNTPHALSSQLDLLPNAAVHSVPVRNSTGLTWPKNVPSGANSEATMPTVISTDSPAAPARQPSMTFSPIRRRPEVRLTADRRSVVRLTFRLRPCS
jgi:electron transfer flavoprotein alpha/beta subunit